ncbi:hypothetical protein [Ruminococcus flavefaciens]|uniref:hypothetical protein n=1 Tax=Ruminococcus flavefaciens TaxID=1265 RepID=UPI0026ED5D78|nr:hypothetical protein [Ruminococcus flavefaciens]MDD7515456.1 hypothetical protein [Ruminococcus flavefaciens]MDY5690180.1 hypothetical protein [Ruminococcus flavefaciens]
MKRRFLSPNRKANHELIQIPEELQSYANSLRLLNDIPLTYLLSNVSDLENESIRFGIVDINWTDAYLDGAFSIGRVCAEDGCLDKLHLKKACMAQDYFETPRMKKMHPNHVKTVRKCMKTSKLAEDFEVISVVLIRSGLMKAVNNINYSAYDENGAPLPILRIDAISDDIMICLFSGLIDSFILEEPMTNLRYGCYKVDDNLQMNPRSTVENNEVKFGQTSEEALIINKKDENIVDENGRLHPKALAEKIEKFLKDLKWLDNDVITPSRFAFEMISVASRGVFNKTK